MKKFLTVVLAVVLALSCLAIPVFADDEAEGTTGDGFDFFSMTAHYTEAVVVSYKYVTKEDKIVKKDVDGNPIKDEKGEDVIVEKGWIFGDPTDTYVVPAVAYTSKDGSTTNFVPGYGEKELGKGKNEYKFYSVVAPAYNIDSKNIAVTDTFGLTGIGDNTAISIISAAKLYGAMDFYDDAGTPNPNFTYKDGYFLDKAVDEDGNNLRIDVNGYVIDKNNIWHSRDGHRIEPFVEVGEKDGEPILVWVDIAARLDEKGKIRDYTTITNQELIDKKVLTLPEKYATLTEEFDSTVDYDEDGKVGSTKDKRAYNSLVKEKTQWLEGYSISMYTIDYIDADGDGKKTEKDLAIFIDANKNETFDEGEALGYNSPDLVITQDNIMVRKDNQDNKIFVQGSPAIGNPLTKVVIKNLTVEIDALGTQMYSDVASDPQQQNEIVITTGDILQNIEAAQAYVAEHPDREYTDGVIIGTAKSVTTKTEMDKTAGAYPSTVKSVDVELVEGVEIPANATLYFNFKVKTQQPEREKNYLKTDKKTGKPTSTLLPINKQVIDVERIPPKPVEATPEPEQRSGCGNMIAGGIAVCAAMAVAFIVLKKKED